MGRPTYEIELGESERKGLIKQIQNEPERRLYSAELKWTHILPEVPLASLRPYHFRSV